MILDDSQVETPIYGPNGVLSEEERFGIRAANNRSETPVHAVADAHAPKIAVAVRYAFAVARRAKNKPDVLRAALIDVLPPVLLQTLVAGGRAGLRMLAMKHLGGVGSGNDVILDREKVRHNPKLRTLRPQVKGQPHTILKPFGLAFNEHDPRAAAWARKHAMELADDISKVTRDRIAEAVANAEETGEDATDAIADAVGDDVRAELIAHTESMRAANVGQRQGWAQAVDEGLLPPDMRRQWIATNDEITCTICGDLDGEAADIDDEYPEPGGEGPPAHPRCRCTEGLVNG